MENIEFKDISLVGKIKMILKEATERQSGHDFSTDMALRAQHTAELYQIIDGISKDETKVEILKTKQRLRDRIQEMENNIKAQVSQLLAEEEMEKSNRAVLQKKHSLKPSPLKVSQRIQHSHEKHMNLSPRIHAQSSPLCQKYGNQCNLVKSQSLESKSCSLLPCPYPAKQFVLPLHSCSCLQNAYFYPLAQPNRIRRQETPVKTSVKTQASFSGSNKDSRLLNAEKLYVKRGEDSTTQYENFSSNKDLKQIEKNLKAQLDGSAFQHSLKRSPHEKSRTGIKEGQNLYPLPPHMPVVIERNATQKSELEKKNKCIQTDKHVRWRTSMVKSREKSREESHKKVLRKHNSPNSARKSYTHALTKPQSVTKNSAMMNIPTRLDNSHKSESVMESDNKMKDYLSESIKELHARAQTRLLHSLHNVDKPTEISKASAAFQTLGDSSILNALNRTEDIATLLLSSFQGTTNTQNSEGSSPDDGDSVDKDLLEKLIVDVLYEDLQSDNIINNESSNTDVHTAEAEDQKNLETEQHSEPEDWKNLDTEQHSEPEESELPLATEVKHVVTPELSPQNSLPSSSSSSSPSSPSLITKQLPATPSLSEQESTSEEVLQQSQSMEFTYSDPQNVSTKHDASTQANDSESHDKEIKKLVQDASVQVSKVSSSGESTLGTVATSVSDTTDEFLSDGELLLKHYGQLSLSAQLDRRQKKSIVTIQDHPIEKVASQISKSSLSEGELPLLKAQRTALNMERQFQIIDGSFDETNFTIPVNSTFEQMWEDISEGQIIPQHVKRNIGPLHLDEVSDINKTCYFRQLSNTLSEGEISVLPAEATPLKSHADTKQDDLSHYLPSKSQNNNLSISSGEIEDDEKLNKSLAADEEENVPELTDAEFFDDDRETVKEKPDIV